MNEVTRPIRPSGSFLSAVATVSALALLLIFASAASAASESLTGGATDLKLTKETTKYALRRALELIVPAHVINRPKLGFPVPIRHWLKDVMYEWARAIITDSQTDALIDKAEALRLLDAHRAGPHDYSRKIWTLLVFMIWHGIFVEERIKPEIPETVYPVRL